MASVIISSGLSVPDAQASSAAAGLSMCPCPDGKIDIYSSDAASVEAWFKGLSSDVIAELVFHKLEPRCLKANVAPFETLQPRIPGYSFFTASEVAQIYGFTAPDTSVNIVMGVMSFGGGLFGSVDADGVLTNGDVQAYWTYLGIPTNRHPRVIIKTIDNATNSPGADSGTAENTLDVETIGGACPSHNLTIILYICPNTLGGMLSLFTYMYNTPVVAGGISYTPNIISCSWGLAEVYYSSSLRNSINSMMATITGAGISICTATGDFGANNNGPTPGYYVDFPSSSPNATAVGGTRLVCQNNTYDGATVETAWTSGGGGTSVVFAKPAYQSAVTGSFRCIPDIAGVADPNTGVVFKVGGSFYVYGGTSVAAPLAAGFLAAINCRSFVNPLLYSAPSN
jgi:kumamolisin